MMSCWNENHYKRPRFSKLVNTFSDLLETDADYLQLSQLPISKEKGHPQKPPTASAMTVNEATETIELGQMAWSTPSIICSMYCMTETSTWCTCPCLQTYIIAIPFDAQRHFWQNPLHNHCRQVHVNVHYIVIFYILILVLMFWQYMLLEGMLSREGVYKCNIASSVWLSMNKLSCQG